MTATPKSPFETIPVSSLEAACEGVGGPLGHPRVFLHIDQDTGSVTCPYCSRQYVLEAGTHRASGAH